jgi:outer membrane protein TolC
LQTSIHQRTGQLLAGAVPEKLIALLLAQLSGKKSLSDLMRSKTVHNSKSYFAALSLLLATQVAGWCQQSTPTLGEVLSLDQAINIALQNNRSLKNARLSVEKGDDEIAATRTSRFPSAHFYALVSQNIGKQETNLTNPLTGVFPGIGPFFTLSTPSRPTAVFAAQVLQPISQQYRIGLAIGAVKLARGEEQQKLRSEEQSLVNNVKKTYHGILQSESALENVRDEVKSYRELDRVTGEFVLQQVVLKSDHLQVQTRLAKAEYEAVDLTNRLSTQKEQLNTLLARDVLTDFNVSRVADATVFEYDLSASRRRALERRPELSEARLRIEQAKLDKRLKRSEYIPDVSIGFTSLSLRNFDQVVPKNIASVGVVMSWEPFDWGRKKRQLAEKSKTIEQSENALKETEDQILIEVGDKFRRLQQTQQALRVARLSQDADREALRVTQGRYKFEAALLTDVLQSQAKLAEANNQYQQALLSFWTANAELEKAIGEDK